MNNKSNSRSSSAEKGAVVPYKSNAHGKSTVPALSQEEKLDASLSKLQAAYDVSVSQTAAIVSGMVEVGRCVVDVVNNFPPTNEEGKRQKPKNQWTVLEINKRLPFGWVQALRYKKIFEKREELAKKLKEAGSDLVGNITVEAAYRLLGEPRPKQSDFGTKEPMPYLTGTRFGVSGEPLESRHKQLSDELKRSEAEAEVLNKKVQELRELEGAYGFVRTFLAKPNLFEKPPKIARDWCMAFSLVAKERKEVKTAYDLLQVSAQCPVKGALSSFDLKTYRSWVLARHEDQPAVAVKKLTMFAHNPKAALESDADLKAYREEKLAKWEAEKAAKKAAATAARKAYREEEKKAVAVARAQWRKEHPRKPARAA